MRSTLADAAQDLRVARAAAREAFHDEMLRASKRYAQAVSRADMRYAGARAQVRDAAVERRDWRRKLRGMSGDHLAQVHEQLLYTLAPERAIRVPAGRRAVYAQHLAAVEEEMTRPDRTQDLSVAL